MAVVFYPQGQHVYPQHEFKPTPFGHSEWAWFVGACYFLSLGEVEARDPLRRGDETSKVSLMEETVTDHRCYSRARVEASQEKRGLANQWDGGVGWVGQCQAGCPVSEEIRVKFGALNISSTQSSVFLRTGGHRREISGVTHIVCRNKTTTEQLGRWLRVRMFATCMRSQVTATPRTHARLYLPVIPGLGNGKSSRPSLKK